MFVFLKITLAYETWGKLNDKKDNVVLIQTGLSASSHAKSHEGTKKKCKQTERENQYKQRNQYCSQNHNHTSKQTNE